MRNPLRFLSRPSRTEYQQQIATFLTQTLSVRPKEIGLYEIAFTHKSYYRNKPRNVKQNNERLEYLGDTVLSTIVADWLYHTFPQKTEGELTRLRAGIVSRATLNEIGEKIELEPLIRYQKSGNAFNALLGNTLEALIGAIYLDKGYQKTVVIVTEKILAKHINLSAELSVEKDFKSRLLEYAQKQKQTARFVCEEESHKNGRKYFRIAAHFADDKLATASDFSKRKAEQKAARQALKILKNKDHDARNDV